MLHESQSHERKKCGALDYGHCNTVLHILPCLCLQSLFHFFYICARVLVHHHSIGTIGEASTWFRNKPTSPLLAA